MEDKMRKFLSVLLDNGDILVVLLILLFIGGIIFNMQGGELLNTAFLLRVPWVSIVLSYIRHKQRGYCVPYPLCFYLLTP